MRETAQIVIWAALCKRWLANLKCLFYFCIVPKVYHVHLVLKWTQAVSN